MIDNIHIQGFRCFEDFKVEKFGRINLLVGKNNSGKTALMQAVRLLADGRSVGAWAQTFPWLTQHIPSTSTHPGDEYQRVAPLFYGYRPKEQVDQLRVSGVVAQVQHTMSAHCAFAMIADGPARAYPTLHVSFEPKGTLESPILFALTPMATGAVATVTPIEGVPEQGVWVGSGEAPAPLVASLLNRALGDLDLEEKLAAGMRAILPNYAGIRFFPMVPLEQPAGQEFNLFRSNQFLKQNFSVILGRTKVAMSTLGDGTWRYLTLLAAALRAGGGYLFIDEIETGIHHSLAVPLWRSLAQQAKSSGTQLFVTTHSEDVVRALAEVAAEQERDDVYIHRLEPDRRPNEALTIDPEAVRALAEYRVEVR